MAVSKHGQQMPASPERNSIRDIAELEELLSEPTEGIIRALAASSGDIVISGVGGKMGSTLARIAQRASHIAGISRRVIGVSRFSSSELEQQLRTWAIETVRCDLLDKESLASLPDAANVIYLGGNEVWFHPAGMAHLGSEHSLPVFIIRFPR